ncbi:MAG: Gfo/Idh/MocA family oxidoreductase [Actinobacteria bacterium]|nr:Gfo/Idh/MocA family oxidoreductase [Actinomycetota bacterium]
MSAVTDRPLSVVLVGYGLGGRLFHAPLIAATPDLALDAIVTSNPERAAQARHDHPDATIYQTPEQAWAGGHELAAISTANITHVPYAKAALEAGLHVVLDKPIAADADTARELAEIARAHDRHLIPYQNRRWDSDIRTAQRVLAEGRLGNVHRFESRIVKMRVIPKEGWRGSAAPEDLGGLLYDLGVHAIDQAMQLIDDSSVILTHTSGAISIMTVSQVTAIGEPRMLLLGTRGGLRIDVADAQEVELAAGGDPAAPDWGVRLPGTEALLRTFDDASNPTDQWVPLERGAWPDFYAQTAAAIRGQGRDPVTIDDGVETMRVMDAARLAAETGTIVRLEPPAGHTYH